MAVRAAMQKQWKMLFAALGLVFCCAHIASAQSNPELLDENGLLSPGTAKTTNTVPTSPYENPTMSLEEQETRSRNSSAAQQVNRDLNTDFTNYREPVAGLAFVAAILASIVLAGKAAWLGIPFASAVATVVQRGFFRWPTTPLEWVNKLAIYIGLVDFAWMMAT